MSTPKPAHTHGIDDCLPHTCVDVVRIVYAPAVHFTMSDGIEYGDISSLQLVTATAHFDTPMRWVDDEGADFSTEGAVITGWALLDDSTYDLGESSCRACCCCPYKRPHSSLPSLQCCEWDTKPTSLSGSTPEPVSCSHPMQQGKTGVGM